MYLYEMDITHSIRTCNRVVEHWNEIRTWHSILILAGIDERLHNRLRATLRACSYHRGGRARRLHHGIGELTSTSIPPPTTPPPHQDCHQEHPKALTPDSSRPSSKGRMDVQSDVNMQSPLGSASTMSMNGGVNVNVVHVGGGTKEKGKAKEKAPPLPRYEACNCAFSPFIMIFHLILHRVFIDGPCKQHVVFERCAAMVCRPFILEYNLD
ncbi:hypothetical protein BT69DRAFT_260259 [Atractiella rhizophila]|nr:hypothetical protein BT69DRAFT_260259 [Atractiella rhizophila]